MIKVLGAFPVAEWANGGISSWSRKFVKTFPNEEFELITINTAPNRLVVESGLVQRIKTGLTAMCRVLKDAYKVLSHHKIAIMHTTTSGNLGTLRDYLLACLCKCYKVKTVMHCRYGCITEDYTSKGLLGWLLRRTMNLYDQIWVLDSRSLNTLKQHKSLCKKVYLTPNSLEVPETCILAPKNYKRVGFIGNLVPEKGVMELVRAVVALNGEVHLDIVGPALPETIEEVKEVAKDAYGKYVITYGRMNNTDVVQFMKGLDILALPTYYPSEAFPISILEAMSLGKMVISTPRAAIPDMLTGLNGDLCGLLVREKSVEDIIKAISWCQQNATLADVMCRRAYEKVYNCYRTEVIYELYRNLYKKLI